MSMQISAPPQDPRPDSPQDSSQYSPQKPGPRQPSRKKFAVPPVKLACLSCRNSHLRCNGSQPCYRCGTRGLQCSYSQSRRGMPSRTAQDEDERETHDSEWDHISPDFQPSADVFLPPLDVANGLDHFEFDGTQSDGLDAFFASLFATPSYPQPPLSNHSEPSSATIQRNLHILRKYQCDSDVLDAYYHLIHPSFPILPKLSKPDRETDSTLIQPTASLFSADESFADYQPSSPLILALLSILVLLPDADYALEAEGVNQDLRFRFSQSLAECACESIEIYTSRADLDSPPLDPDRSDVWLRTDFPDKLQIPTALCILSVQAYLHGGNLPKMLLQAERALDYCMQMSLHQFVEQGPQAEGIRRTWWMAYLCYCNACIVNCQVRMAFYPTWHKSMYATSVYGFVC
ncbi:hypothetical protein BGZ61DRAFT_468633 [Ilyonectria robusta]|uniref:uncharacterized protein n=1 Tax=Ilyonectria robusta TaxID=1079257 RepID=UPI001E8DD0D4|nr:uncharacterized protein BGZ61DRAFT_468633 [Ilyonectria robusta]KAH8652580.1 hypothetical protein BGZ61DRAFT_468633 [Ilyonectria robusta]